MTLITQHTIVAIIRQPLHSAAGIEWPLQWQPSGILHLKNQRLIYVIKKDQNTMIKLSIFELLIQLKNVLIVVEDYLKKDRFNLKWLFLKIICVRHKTPPSQKTYVFNV